MELNATTFSAFWADVQEIADFLTRQTRRHDADWTLPRVYVERNLSNLPRDCYEHHRSTRAGLLERTLGFTQLLLTQVGNMPMLNETLGGALGGTPGWVDRRWVAEYFQSGVVSAQPSAKDMEGRDGELLMEQLTVAWLVLYFLSVPMGHAWERVRRIADEQGGYPAGVCMAKSIGDVYRGARMNALRRAKEGPLRPGDEDLVLVLSAHPSLLSSDLLTRPDKKLTPDAGHQLGRCYALLQLRLLVALGLPLRYIVPTSSFRRAWEYALNSGRFDAGRAAADALHCLDSVFHRRTGGQSVEVLADSLESGVPPCVLGPRSGVYMLDTASPDIRFGGNRVSDRLLSTYRHRLGRKDLGTQPLLDQSEAQLAAMFVALANPGRTPAF